MVRRLTENSLRVIVRMLREEQERYRRKCRENKIDGCEVLSLVTSAIDALEEAEQVARRLRMTPVEGPYG